VDEPRRGDAVATLYSAMTREINEKGKGAGGEGRAGTVCGEEVGTDAFSFHERKRRKTSGAFSSVMAAPNSFAFFPRGGFAHLRIIMTVDFRPGCLPLLSGFSDRLGSARALLGLALGLPDSI